MAALLLWASGERSVYARDTSHGCLYAVTKGPEKTPVVPCVNADPLNIAGDPDIRKVMKAFGVEPWKVRFKGCKNIRFSVKEDRMHARGSRKYLITYPNEVEQSYVALITHELAHVLQMEMAGGYRILRDTFITKRIELGADYLTGIIYSNYLKKNDINQFQHHLSLMGQYLELDEDAHGNPSQRSGAFRFGLFFDFNTVDRDIRKASENFQFDVYGQIIQF